MRGVVDDAPLLEHEGCRVDRLAPAPLVELRTGTIDKVVEARQIKAVLVALLEPGLDVTVHERVRPVLKGNPGKELVGVLDVLVEFCLLGEAEAPLQVLATPGRPLQVLQRADADLGVAEDLGIVEVLRELDRPCAPDQRSFGVLGESAKPQSGAVRHRELVSGLEPLEQSYGLLAGLRRLGYSAGTPEKRRESAQRVALAHAGRQAVGSTRSRPSAPRRPRPPGRSGSTRTNGA